MSTQLRWLCVRLLLPGLVATCLLPSLSRASSDDAVGVGVVSTEGQAAPISFRVNQAGGVLLEPMEEIAPKASAVFAGAFDPKAVMHDALLKQKQQNAGGLETLSKKAESFEEGNLLRAEGERTEEKEEESSSSWFAKLLVACAVYICYKQKAQLCNVKPNDAKLASWRASSIVASIAAKLRKVDPIRFYLARQAERPSWLVKPNGQEINTLFEAVQRLGEVAKEWRSPPAKHCISNDDEDLLRPPMMRVLAGFKDLEEEDEIMTMDAAEEAVAFPERSQAGGTLPDKGQQACLLSERHNSNASPFAATNPFYTYEYGSTLLDCDFEQDLL